ncbi:MAG: hypothetical protein EP335_03445 [Alphaproteobacteria bacterium]|nr:MAG: hypothetical protein EP335_03445 [Alphaproteobacteria bacterium]
MIAEFLLALFLIGIPLGLLSYFLVRWSLAAEAHKPGSDDKSMKEWLKALKKRPKKERKSTNMVHDKWMRFGGGFYGCMSVFTYLYIEVKEVLQFIAGLANLADWLSKLGFDLLVQFFINSLMNFLKAILWFTYWPDEVGADNPFVWLLAAFVGYYVGSKLAWHEAAGDVTLPDWKQHGLDPAAWKRRFMPGSKQDN